MELLTQEVVVVEILPWFTAVEHNKQVLVLVLVALE
jgi:hypothetical protein